MTSMAPACNRFRAMTRKDLFETESEMKFDSRLIEKKIEHGFLSRSERDQFLKTLPEETEFEFTSMEQIENDVQNSEES